MGQCSLGVVLIKIKNENFGPKKQQSSESNYCYIKSILKTWMSSRTI